jgi:beta-galactosidase GanA
MNAGYESGGYGMIQLDGTLTERSRRAGATAKIIQQNCDLLLAAKPKPAEAAIVFSPLVPLLGGYDEENSRTAMHKALAGYHRMFFERNIPVEVLSSRELAGQNLQKYKLIVLPYPLMMTNEEAMALREYVEKGGHLFVEARPGWVDEEGHAEPAIPGFDWTQMLGVRETSIDPAKEVAVNWNGASFTGSNFAERLTILDSSTKVVAKFADGTPAAYEHKYGKGEAILLGTFAGQWNEANPVSHHPLGEILSDWAGLSLPELKAPALVELREMDAPAAKFIFLFNHADTSAKVEFAATLDKPAEMISEIISGETLRGRGKRFSLATELPAQSVRIYRIDF